MHRVKNKKTGLTVVPYPGGSLHLNGRGDYGIIKDVEASEATVQGLVREGSIEVTPLSEDEEILGDYDESPSEEHTRVLRRRQSVENAKSRAKGQ